MYTPERIVPESLEEIAHEYVARDVLSAVGREDGRVSGLRKGEKIPFQNPRFIEHFEERIPSPASLRKQTFGVRRYALDHPARHELGEKLREPHDQARHENGCSRLYTFSEQFRKIAEKAFLVRYVYEMGKLMREKAPEPILVARSVPRGGRSCDIKLEMSRRIRERTVGGVYPREYDAGNQVRFRIEKGSDAVIHIFGERDELVYGGLVLLFVYEQEVIGSRLLPSLEGLLCMEKSAEPEGAQQQHEILHMAILQSAMCFCKGCSHLL